MQNCPLKYVFKRINQAFDFLLCERFQWVVEKLQKGVTKICFRQKLWKRPKLFVKKGVLVYADRKSPTIFDENSSICGRILPMVGRRRIVGVHYGSR